MGLIDIVYKISKEFIALTLTVVPYFILGSAFGALLKTYLKPNFAFKYLNRGTSSIINASILGAILPGCACATMPMAEGLKEKGVNLATIATFIMVSPLLSPQTAVLTYALLGWKFYCGQNNIFFNRRNNSGDSFQLFCKDKSQKFYPTSRDFG